MSADRLVDWEQLRELERFLYREARILDEERLDDWLQLLDPDIHYWVPGIEVRYRRDPHISTASPDAGMSHFDDTFLDLQQRVARVNSGLAWAEDPATRTCRVVSNIEAELEEEGVFLVRSNIVLFRGKNERDQHTLFARREDRICRGDKDFRIKSRKALIGQSILLFKNLNVFL